MPIKHQAACYRTRKGLRYVNDGDICDATFGALHIQAKARVRELREEGHKAFAERHPDGYYQVFVWRAGREVAGECDHGTRNCNVIGPHVLCHPTFYECDICGHCHPWEFNGDCRDDANRFTCEQLDAKFGGPNGYELRTMSERVEQDQQS